MPKRQYSNREVNRAGEMLKNLASGEEALHADEVLTYWRYIHLPVINTFQAMLRQKLKSDFDNGFISQRLKRRSSIVSKLIRPGNESKQLSTMQDIAGIRAVVDNLDDVWRLTRLLGSHSKHKRRKFQDYISSQVRRLSGRPLCFRIHDTYATREHWTEDRSANPYTIDACLGDSG
ncbi:MAG: RelA/SpoT domain-containing protein [Ignavibacteria bacterium]|nr:RelA/SpoT domain-containing protein [Ignavibacteria bacterium]